MILGIDTGGTFTDFVLYDGKSLLTHKVLSTPSAPEKAILKGIADMGLVLEDLSIVHGSTVATNAVLQGKLARTVFITNHGLGDMLTIGRQTRRELYNLQPEPVPPPVPAELCLETSGRLSAGGELLEPFSAEADEQLKSQLSRLKPESIAINLLFSFQDASQEKHIEALVADDIFVTRSSSLLPVYREYERGMTTWLNAATGPLMKRYLGQLSQQCNSASLTILQSSGDTIDAEQASDKAAYLLLSGPAGGLLGAQAIARQAGHERLMTFDMGGTSSDVSLIDGSIRLTDEGRIAGYPVAVPMVDMHTIGAGGGSLVWLDDGGLLQVGPQSAGADPGPACYAKGGRQATVTDANVVLGRLPSQVELAGQMRLDHEAAYKAVSLIAAQLNCGPEKAAVGIIELANEHMAAALRVISVEKGHRPDDFILVGFGGAGGMHVCDLADELGMGTALAPVNAGVLSAYGMLVAPRGRRYIRTFIQPILSFDHRQAESLFSELEEQGRVSLTIEGIEETDMDIQRMADVRYIGQSSTIRVEWQAVEIMLEAFHQQHRQRFGHALDVPLELVNLHVSVQAEGERPDLAKIKPNIAPPIGRQQVYQCKGDVPVYDRTQMGAGQILEGPALVIEPSATTWVKPGWVAEMDQYGNIRLVRKRG